MGTPKRKSSRRKSGPQPFPSAPGEPGFLFDAINRRGETIHCEVMFTFQADGQDYMVYTDNTHTFLGQINLYATRYDPETFQPGRPPFLRDPESEREWEMIRRVTRRMMD